MYLVDHNQQVLLLQTLVLDLLQQQTLLGIRTLKVFHSQVLEVILIHYLVV